MAKKDEKEILTRDDVLELLSMKAAEGSVTAMVCLERALRYQRRREPDEIDDELDDSSAGMTELHEDEAIAIAETLERCSL